MTDQQEIVFARLMLKSILDQMALIDEDTLNQMVELDDESFMPVDNGTLPILDPTYYDRDNRTLYVCPLPTIGVKISFKPGKEKLVEELSNQLKVEK